MANPDAWASGVSMGKKAGDKDDDKDKKDTGASNKFSGFSKDMAKPSSFKKGGKVKKSGMARVHKGEIVLTVEQAKECTNKSKKGSKKGPHKKVASKG